MNSKINSIQILRGIAALLVVQAHSIDLIEQNNKFSWQSTFLYLENFGAIGVDIFFIISGFIMVLVTRNLLGWSSVKSFLLKRYIRIYALYIPILLITLFIFRINFPNFITILKDITLIPLFDNGTWINPSIMVSWTLAFEITFYLLIAIPIFFSKKWHIFISALLILILSILGTIYQFSDVHTIFITNPMQLEFLFGIFIAIVYTNKIDFNNYYLIIALAAGIGFYSYSIINGYGRISELDIIMNEMLAFKRIIWWGMPSALIVFSFIFIEKKYNPMIMNNRILILIGDSSYSIYLIHKILFYYLFRFNFLSILLLKLNGDALIFILIILASISGIIIHLYFEKKALSFLNKLVGFKKE